jgi:hypothetical protein
VPINPRTGKLVTTSSLGINEADSMTIPRNSNLVGSSRTSAERKQIRDAFLMNYEDLGENPVILDIMEALNDLERQALYTPQSTAFDFPLVDGVVCSEPIVLPRVEGPVGSLKAYAVWGKVTLEPATHPGDMTVCDVTFRLQTLGLCEKNLSVVFEGPKSTSGLVYRTQAFMTGTGTNLTVTHSYGAASGDQSKEVTITIGGYVVPAEDPDTGLVPRVLVDGWPTGGDPVTATGFFSASLSNTNIL